MHTARTNVMQTATHHGCHTSSSDTVIEAAAGGMIVNVIICNQKVARCTPSHYTVAIQLHKVIQSNCHHPGNWLTKENDQCVCKYITHWLIDWVKVYVSLDTKQVISETFPKPISWHGMDKINLTQQKHAFTNQKKCTTARNKHKKTKYRFSYLLRHPARKRRWPILISSLHKFVTYLNIYPLTALEHTGPHAAECILLRLLTYSAVNWHILPYWLYWILPTVTHIRKSSELVS